MLALNLYKRSQRILTSSISSSFCLTHNNIIPANLTNLNLIRNYSQCNTIKNNKSDAEINIQDINIHDIDTAIKSIKDNNDLKIKQLKQEDLKDAIKQIHDIHSNINLPRRHVTLERVKSLHKIHIYHDKTRIITLGLVQHVVLQILMLELF